MSESRRSNNFHKVVKYTRSTIDYAGIVSWSILSRLCDGIKVSVLKMDGPMFKNATELFIDKRHKTRKSVSKNAYVDEKINKIEETILQLKERLVFLEKYGVQLSKKGVALGGKKEIDEEKKAILRQIVEENKYLREIY